MLEGGAGDDQLLGRGGADELDGGAGSDTALYTGSVDGVTVDLITGTGIGGDAQGDTLANIENVTGSDQDDVLSGNTGANVLAGGAGQDTLAGGGGDDSLLGDAGDDRLEGGVGADTLTGGTGTDTAVYAGSSSAVTVDLAAGTGTERRCGRRHAERD